MHILCCLPALINPVMSQNSTRHEQVVLSLVTEQQRIKYYRNVENDAESVPHELRMRLREDQARMQQL